MRRSGLTIVAATAALAVFGATAAAQGGGMGRGRMGMMMAGQDSATAAQMRVFHELVINNTRITRTVENLPNGIRTVTQSDDPRLAALIKDHVATMNERVVKADDPGLPMESPALRMLFKNSDKIQTSIETTPSGTVVVQTSGDSAVVVALQQHAADVSDLVKRGRDAMHEAMMKGMPGMAADSMRAKPPVTKP